jgi:xylulokinase
VDRTCWPNEQAAEPITALLRLCHFLFTLPHYFFLPLTPLRAQIAKIARQQPNAYNATEHISLVSSFMASLFIGDFAPIDTADGSGCYVCTLLVCILTAFITGMNLMDIHTKSWWNEALEATAPNLALRLPSIVAPHTVIGLNHIHLHLFPRKCLSLNCPSLEQALSLLISVNDMHFLQTVWLLLFQVPLVISSQQNKTLHEQTGDNPNSVAGMRLGDGDIAISLGTSDTVSEKLVI